MCAYYDSLQIPAHAISRSVVWSLEIVMFYYVYLLPGSEILVQQGGA